MLRALPVTQENVDILPAAAVSLDISSIAHFWDRMERRLHHLQNQPVSLAKIGTEFIRIWNNMQEAFCNTLIRTMRRRCQDCINGNDGHTSY